MSPKNILLPTRAKVYRLNKTLIIAIGAEIIGDNNVIRGNNNIIRGNNNIIAGDYCRIYGDRNKCGGQINSSQGRRNTHDTLVGITEVEYKNVKIKWIGPPVKRPLKTNMQ